MADSIVGAAGYTGQERRSRSGTGPRLVAVGWTRWPAPRVPSTHAAHAACPFVTNDEARARCRRHDLCLSHEAAAAIELRPRCRRRPLGRPSLAGRLAYERGTASPIRARRARRLGLRAAELVAESGRWSRTGCYGDPCSRSPVEGRDRARLRRRRRLSGMTGAGAPEGSRMPARCSRTCAVSRRAHQQHVPEITQLLGFPVSFTPTSCPCAV
jgi:N-acetyl-gamma-glutamylphosphate reductase